MLHQNFVNLPVFQKHITVRAKSRTIITIYPEYILSTRFKTNFSTSSKNKFKTFIVLFFFFLFFSPTHAQENKSDLIIDATYFEIDNNQNLITAGGGVKMTRGGLQIDAQKAAYTHKEKEVSLEKDIVLSWEDLKIFCDKMVFRSLENKIEASGNLKVFYKEIEAEGKIAFFDLKEQKIFLPQNPVFHETNDTLTGEKITFWLKDKKILVEGKSKVVISGETLNK